MPDPVPEYVVSPVAGFLRSLPIDRRLVREDLAGSIAHVEMLGRCGLLTPEEAARLAEGLRSIAREVAAGTFPWRDELEDVHTNIERRLVEHLGELGGRLHTARSRNDQVAVDERLWLRDAVHRVVRGLVELEAALLDRANSESSTPMPGYTHLQRAQVVSLGHHLLAHFWRFSRDADRLAATAARADVCPLGAGALAGSTLPIDPLWTAARLGFGGTFENSLDAVSDRDPLAELLFDLALTLVHASGFGEEVVLFASTEFGFVERAALLGGGSSLMPQKRNPDAAELVRAKAGAAIGDLVALLATLKGLPLAYDRDLQEDKAPALASVERALTVLDTLRTLVQGLEFDRDRLREAAGDPQLYATDAAERRVASGTAFREAHRAVAAEGPHSPGDAPETPEAGLARRRTHGGPSDLGPQLEAARSRLEAQRAFLSSLGRKVALVEELLQEGTR